MSSKTIFMLCFLAQPAHCLLGIFGRCTPGGNRVTSQSTVFFSASSTSASNTKIRSAVALSSMQSTSRNVQITIEYCSGCQWMLRSIWLASELLTTFSQESTLGSVALIPKSPPLSPGGVFRVLAKEDFNRETVLWDRSVQGRFPEAKEVKQAVRDVVNPDKDLGHSENKDGTNSVKTVECLECKEIGTNELTIFADGNKENQTFFPQAFYENNIISIDYSTGATISSPENKLHKAMWYASEVLNMVYERNAWWKKNKDLELVAMKDAAIPASVDGVTLVPIRDKLDVLVCYNFWYYLCEMCFFTNIWTLSIYYRMFD